MIGGKRVLALIPARGGSKGVERKNLREVGGRSLLDRTISVCIGSKYVDSIVLSTDDDEIAKVGLELGASLPFIRPMELAGDNATSASVVLHALENLSNFSIIVFLQPTSPFRSIADVDGCIELMADGIHSVVSINKISHSPYWMYTHEKESQRLVPFIATADTPTRRQDSPSVYELNGAVYVLDVEAFSDNPIFVSEHSLGYEMPKERSFDIDTELDLTICDLLASTSLVR
tara:strand:- start:18217 stop:18912 length:696 start_codon:yes stop_codon:yes gene_type:complete